MAETFARLGQRLADGQIDAGRFETGMRAELRAGSNAAMRFAKGGPLTDRELGSLNALLDEQNDYLRDFVRKIHEGGPLSYIPARAALYAGSATQAAALGQIAAGEGKVRWVLGGGEHCAECPGMAGTHQRADLVSSGRLPGRMACRGNCHCYLEDAG